MYVIFFLIIDDIEGKVEAAFSGCNTDGKDGLTWMEVVHCIVSQFTLASGIDVGQGQR